MTSFTKSAYWGLLVTNAESVVDTTNPYLKKTCDPPVAEDAVEFFMVDFYF